MNNGYALWSVWVLERWLQKFGEVRRFARAGSGALQASRESQS